MIFVLLLFIILWLVSGSFGFIYWWTSEFDLTSNEISNVLCISLIGPLAWIIGYFVHGQSSNKILIKKRN